MRAFGDGSCALRTLYGSMPTHVRNAPTDMTRVPDRAAYLDTGRGAGPRLSIRDKTNQWIIACPTTPVVSAASPKDPRRVRANKIRPSPTIQDRSLSAPSRRQMSRGGSGRGTGRDSRRTPLLRDTGSLSQPARRAAAATSWHAVKSSDLSAGTSSPHSARTAASVRSRTAVSRNSTVRRFRGISS